MGSDVRPLVHAERAALIEDLAGLGEAANALGPRLAPGAVSGGRSWQEHEGAAPGSRRGRRRVESTIRVSEG
ncbi:hypothetical protein K3N28_18930 [Glycomyces sp. TRM65418]|uniref:hypothetical protein n=1 Tax=Glycomyces sp. TRM65418 TaxID=2867006 RepID=UPI001CE57F14|nr:hypothetical protein [Glycomyces sp. TRM65418]MCC3765139.1 hypothetical protein [Glycomyces sp. TRM65418]QZD54767.1 hypothetical protein K3N28_18840 [Glycomyces sp. TRM65418]